MPNDWPIPPQHCHRAVAEGEGGVDVGRASGGVAASRGQRAVAHGNLAIGRLDGPGIGVRRFGLDADPVQLNGAPPHLDATCIGIAVLRRQAALV